MGDSILVSWMLACYRKIERQDVDFVQRGMTNDYQLEDDVEAKLFDLQGSQWKATQSHWDILEQVLKEAQSPPRSQEAGGGRQAPGGMTPPATGMTGQTRMLYVLAVFGSFFGLGTIAVLRLSRRDHDKAEKTQKKAGKAEKKF